MDFQTNKTLGGVGAILLLIGCLTFISPAVGILGLIGLILVLISLNGFAELYNEKGIFNNALYGIIIFVIGFVITIAVAIFILVDFLKNLGIDMTNWQSLQTVDWKSIMTPDKIMGLISSGIIALVILFIFSIIGAYFLKKSLDLLSAKTGVKLFSTTAIILLLGAVLTIILVGFILVFVAIILLIISFFSIGTPAQAPEARTPPVQNP
ncbi:MAG: DUF996 domain-containing protein [Candidatus Thermoplasmatota archaeon]|nr:DUF996 domain-containing protein [Candidatus Thermoplasmatota archaeon]